MSDTNELVREAIQRIAVGPDRGRDISFEDAKAIMLAILEGEVDDVQTAVILIALRMKRESLEEFKGLFEALQQSIDQIEIPSKALYCLADPFDGYSRHLTMTPFMPAVMASLGLTTVIHGVETVGPKHGITASKVYQASGKNTVLPQSDVATQLNETGWGYLDQSVYAPSLFRLSALRDRIVKRTAITTLERLLMPIRGQQTHLVLGYVHKAYPEIYSIVAQLAGYHTSLLIKGVEGGLAPALNKPLRRYFLQNDREIENNVDTNKEILHENDQFNSSLAAQPNEEPDINKATQQCLELGLAVLSGEKGMARNSLCFAVAQILYAHQHTQSLEAAVEKVQNCLDNGSALAHFNGAYN